MSWISSKVVSSRLFLLTRIKLKSPFKLSETNSLISRALSTITESCKHWSIWTEFPLSAHLMAICSTISSRFEVRLLTFLEDWVLLLLESGPPFRTAGRSVASSSLSPKKFPVHWLNSQSFYSQFLPFQRSPNLHKFWAKLDKSTLSHNGLMCSAGADLIKSTEKTSPHYKSGPPMVFESREDNLPHQGRFIKGFGDPPWWILSL